MECISSKVTPVKPQEKEKEKQKAQKTLVFSTKIVFTIDTKYNDSFIVSNARIIQIIQTVKKKS